MARLYWIIAATLGGLAVAAGAFGTHMLRGQLSDRSLEIFETAARYQMYHALALLAIALLIRQQPNTKLLKISGAAMTIGVLLFSGSLYALSLTGVGQWGAVAPVGGLGLLVGWGVLAIAAFPSPEHQSE